MALRHGWRFWIWYNLSTKVSSSCLLWSSCNPLLQILSSLQIQYVVWFTFLPFKADFVRQYRTDIPLHSMQMKEKKETGWIYSFLWILKAFNFILHSLFSEIQVLLKWKSVYTCYTNDYFELKFCKFIFTLYTKMNYLSVLIPVHFLIWKMLWLIQQEPKISTSNLNS